VVQGKNISNKIFSSKTSIEGPNKKKVIADTFKDLQASRPFAGDVKSSNALYASEVPDHGKNDANFSGIIETVVGVKSPIS